MNTNKVTNFTFNNAKVNNFVEGEIVDIVITSVDIYDNDGKFRAVIGSKDLDGNKMQPIRTYVTSEYVQKATFGAIANQLGLYGDINVLMDFNGKQIKVQMIKKSVTDPLTGNVKIYDNFIFDPERFEI